MIKWNNCTTTCPVVEQKKVWLVLKRIGSSFKNPIVVDYQTDNYIEAIAQVLHRRRKVKNGEVYKLMSRVGNQKIDFNSVAVHANFK